MKLRSRLESLPGDLFGGVTAMIVALPLSLSLGIATGLGAAAGIYSAIAVGLWAAAVGGVKGQISGPTAPMAVAMAVIVSQHTASTEEALTVVMLSGLFLIGLGLSGLGRFAVYTPHVVISGFMSGIGIIMIVMPIPVFLGMGQLSGDVMKVARMLPEALEQFESNNGLNALIIASTTFLVGAIWPRRLSRWVPGPLAALAVGTLLCLVWFGGVKTIGNIGKVPSGLPELTMPAWPGIKALGPALMLAMLCTIDTLLTALIADSMMGSQHRPNRELVGQGLGNLTSGLVGGIPGSGSTPLTVTNIRTGGSTRISGVAFALAMLVVLLSLGQYVEHIPLAALAGVLAKVGMNIVDWRLLARIHRIRKEHLAVMLLTLFLTVFVDLIVAVGIGLIASGLSHARQLERLELDSVASVPLLDRTFFAGLRKVEDFTPYSARVGMVSLKGNFTVASSNKLVNGIGPDIRQHEVVILDFTHTRHIDDSAAMVIGQLIDLAKASRTHCIVMGLGGDVARTLEALDVLREIPEERIVKDRKEAQPVALELLGIEREEVSDPAPEGGDPSR